MLFSFFILFQILTVPTLSDLAPNSINNVQSMPKRTTDVFGDSNHQKTHYFIDPRKRVKPNHNHGYRIFSHLLTGEPKSRKSLGTPLNNLFNGKETDANVKQRYELLNKVWSHQISKIETILKNTNLELFQNLFTYIEKPVMEKSKTAKTISNECKLPIGFLSLTSNNANNIRILDELNEYLKETNNLELKTINLNSKNCANIKSTMREIIRQFMNIDKNRGKSNSPEVNAKDDEEFDTADEELHQSESEDETPAPKATEADEDAQISHALGGRISYDFDVVEDWCRHYYERNKTNLSESKLRIVLIIEDSDSIHNDVLNQLLKLLHSYCSKLPLHVFMALSSNNVSSWINSHLTNPLRTIINGIKFSSNDNKDLGFKVLEELFLKNEVTDNSPISIDSRLSLIVLNRFENSNNSIDSLVSELKLSFMIYFYQLPLSLMIDSRFKPTKLHIEALRKLSSFKEYMELKLHQFSDLKKLIEGQTFPKNQKSDMTSKIDDLKGEMKKLLLSDKAVMQIFNQAKLEFQVYRNSIINAVNLLYEIDPSKKQKFQIYKTITNNQLINSKYLTDCLRTLKGLKGNDLAKVVEFVRCSPVLRPHLNNQISDEYIIKLQSSLSLEEDAEELRHNLTKYFNENVHLNKKINDNLFNELFTFDGGVSELELSRPPKFIEENLQNLLINLVRPSLRQVLESALDDAHSYLSNELIKSDGDKESLAPMLSKLYDVYKDAPVNINIYDFYVAFKQSLPKEAIIEELSQSSDFKEVVLKLKQSDDQEELWRKVTYSWFLQSCFELISFGLLKEKTKGDFLEKSIWKGV